MGKEKGSKGNIPPETVEISPDDVGQVSEIIAPVEVVETPQEVVVKKEKVLSDIEMGKTPKELQNKFLSLYRGLEGIAEKVVHSPNSRRHHFKPMSVVLFYGKTPICDLAIDQGKKAKHLRVHYKLTPQGWTGPDGKSITQKELVAQAVAYKKARGK